MIHQMAAYKVNGVIWFLCSECDRVVRLDQKTKELKFISKGEPGVSHTGIYYEDPGMLSINPPEHFNCPSVMVEDEPMEYNLEPLLPYMDDVPDVFKDYLEGLK